MTAKFAKEYTSIFHKPCKHKFVDMSDKNIRKRVCSGIFPKIFVNNSAALQCYGHVSYQKNKNRWPRSRYSHEPVMFFFFFYMTLQSKSVLASGKNMLPDTQL